MVLLGLAAGAAQGQPSMTIGGYTPWTMKTLFTDDSLPGTTKIDTSAAFYMTPGSQILLFTKGKRYLPAATHDDSTHYSVKLMTAFWWTATETLWCYTHGAGNAKTLRTILLDVTDTLWTVCRLDTVPGYYGSVLSRVAIQGVTGNGNKTRVSLKIGISGR
jgi:hypothetical protein